MIFIVGILSLLSLSSLAQEISMCTLEQMKVCSGCPTSAPYCCARGTAHRGCSANSATWKSSSCEAQCKIADTTTEGLQKIKPKVNLPEISGDDFPLPDNTLSIQYKNSTKASVIIWLDNQAFCPKSSNAADCKQGDDAAWNKNLGKFSIYSKKDGKWVAQSAKSGRKQELAPGQVWRITPPVDNNQKPYWCFDQPAGPNIWKRNCPGVGAWVTPVGVNMPAIEKVSRFEYNINESEIWFNQSAVDGNNLNSSAEYTGCPENKRVCQIDLKGCSNKTKAEGALTCPSPKFWPAINGCGTNNFGAQWNLTPLDLAGCGYGDKDHKEQCHKWWATNRCAQDWLNYLQKNKAGRCETYGWAYDEKRYKPGDSFDSNGNPPANEEIRPLINCPLKPASSLNIDITDILR